MTNQEIITAIEEWCTEQEDYAEDYYDLNDIGGAYVVPTQSLITFLKKLLHE